MTETRGEYRVVPGESRLATYHDQSAVVAVPRLATSGYLRMPSVDELSVMSTLAKAISGSKMYPGFTTEAQAMAGMLLAYDLRRPFSQVLSNAYMIEGRLSLSAQYIAGLVMDAPGCEMRVVEQTDQQCTVTFRRPEWSDEQTFAYTMADAKRAQLDGKAIWKKYPREMLVNRAFGIVARTHFPDVAAGIYTPEEVEDFAATSGAATTVTEVAHAHSRPASVAAITDVASDPAADWERASARFHAAGRNVGLDHDLLKQFVADKYGKTVEEIGSTKGWSPAFFDRLAPRVERDGAEWLRGRNTIEARASAPQGVVETGMAGGVRRTLRDGEFVDRETGEIVPAEDADDERFPATPASLLPSEDLPPVRRTYDHLTN